jgi:2-polyprenyl-3-methyl-5-hydroxy-6-metoxy-1,4-benzoquinol methylase
MGNNLTYFKEIFDAETLEQAKNIVLTPDPNDVNKFIFETNWLIKFINTHLDVKEKTKVLDFGCGMGRISKELIETFDCFVKGIDISDNMLSIAKEYVNSDKFFPDKSHNIQDIDLVISSFVLQHSENPEQDIKNLYTVMKPNSVFVLVNEPNRFVPTGVNENNYVIWNDDKVDVISLMESKFKFINKYIYYNSLPILTLWTKL